MGNKLGKVKAAMTMRMMNLTRKAAAGLQQMPFKNREGVDGILVTVGLCIIALVLCVIMKDELADFIKTLVEGMTTKATGILQG